MTRRRGHGPAPAARLPNHSIVEAMCIRMRRYTVLLIAAESASRAAGGVQSRWHHFNEDAGVRVSPVAEQLGAQQGAAGAARGVGEGHGAQVRRAVQGREADGGAGRGGAEADAGGAEDSAAVPDVLVQRPDQREAVPGADLDRELRARLRGARQRREAQGQGASGRMHHRREPREVRKGRERHRSLHVPHQGQRDLRRDDVRTDALPLRGRQDRGLPREVPRRARVMPFPPREICAAARDADSRPAGRLQSAAG